MSDENLPKKQEAVTAQIEKFNDIISSIAKIHEELIKHEWDDQAKIMKFLNDYFSIELKSKRIDTNYQRQYLG